MHRLPIHDTALAAAIRVSGGHEIEPRTYRDSQTARENATWYATTGVGDAGKVLESHRLGTLSPGHPFTTCVLAIEILRALPASLKTGRVIHCQAAPGHLLRLSDRPADIPAVPAVETIELRSPEDTDRIERHLLSLTLQPGGPPLPLLPHHFAAAAILCGHYPLRYTGTAAQPLLHLTAASITMPGLTLEDLGNAAMGQPAGLPLAPGHTDPAEHPFHYALEAVRTFSGLRWSETALRKNPTHLYKGQGTHTALMSESLIRSNIRIGTRTPRDHLNRHLAGLTS